MEKFLDPSRPYKCTVCKESFTQKNILLVHYNSVSHLHKLKKVLQEASSPVPQETTNSIDNKPFKCNICNVAYSQSSTLEIHMRSVLHQTKARTAKTDMSSSSITGGSGPSPTKSPAPSAQGNTSNSDTARSGTPSSNKENNVEPKEPSNINSTKQTATTDHVSAQTSSHQSAQSSSQLQLQLQHELQQQAAFFQPQFLNPAFFPHFPMTPEALLQFQQPQFLFPFYIPGAEFNINPELALHSAAAFGMPGLTGSFLEDLKQQMQQQHQLQQAQAQQQAQQQQNQASHIQPQIQQQKNQQLQNHKSKLEPNPVSVSDIQMSMEAEDYLEKQENRTKMEGSGDVMSDAVKDNKEAKKSKFSEPFIPPPRIVSGARGNAAKALLENFGFELVIQYNENRQKNQKKNKDGIVHVEMNTDKLEYLTQLCQQQLGLDPNFLRQSQFKRPRTRITDEQLKILRANFDINNSPNEEQIQEMSEKSGLPQKVIKHWFRNTLFKERQRSKDSPYNFNIPPITTLEDIRMEPQLSAHEYYRTDSAINKRSSRTRFTDYQLRVLQDFFDTNAYPKDDEIEQLSTVLNLPTRVIVVWFQNARQKARKSYENQADCKDSEKKELTNERYIRTSSMQYQCKKCNIVFPRIFDLITHQKKLCYKDEDEEIEENTCEEYTDIMDQVPIKGFHVPLELSKQSQAGTATSSGSSSPVMASPRATVGKASPKLDIATDIDLKQAETAPSPVMKSLPEPRPSKACTPQPPPQKVPQPQLSRPHSQPQAATVPSSPLSLALSSLTNSLPHQMLQYQCDQCKIAFPTVELWQEHQHMHFLAAQNQFLHSQFLERPIDMPYMIFDPNNPLMASQLLSGGLSQMPSQSSSSMASATSSGAMKRKLDEKEENANDKDGGNSSEEQHRDKRLRTTITPEQLEILYDKYLLDSNPTRKMLDHIAREVGLKKRVVQVWFQNTRARERKGQFRAIGPSQSHKKCPFCRALFKAKSALDSHIRSRHWHEAKQAGFSLPPSPMMNQDNERGESPNKYNFFDYPQLPTKTEPNDYDLPAASSTPIKPSEAQVKNFLSPSSLKAENCDESEGPTNNSAEVSSYDLIKMDFDETSSINTAISDATTGDEYNNNEVESLTANGGDKLGDNKKGLMLNSDAERFQFSMVSPALSFSGKDCDSYYSSRDDDMDEINDRSESSSLADPSSPSPFGTGNPFSKSGKVNSGGERPGHKRFRTQMSNLQLKVLKACFSDYRTPTMQECEMLGNEIGLPKRVVQVWFQNARAKEKKFKINIGKPFMISQGSPDGPRTECTLCGVKYTARMSVRDHIFSKQHIAKVQETLGNQVDREKDYLAPTTVRQLMAQQELDRMKKAAYPQAIQDYLAFHQCYFLE
uniref:Zinc finger homeobox 4 n=1 Tax=Iconisemion striatum TaxID=60296 RepID=A0A1A7W8I8_9TELE